MSLLLRTVFIRAQSSTTLLQRVCSRNVSRSALRLEKATGPIATEVKAEEAPGNPSHLLGGRRHNPNNLERRFLVWSGKYKSIDEIPDTVSQEAMEKSRNKARIKIANYMILLTIIACFVVVISGKNASKRGESVQQMNLDWHRHIKEEAEAEKHLKEEADAAAAPK